MAEPPTDGGRVLYVIACAAPPARDVRVLVRLAQAEGWDVCVLATPSGRDFLDASALERLTRHPVRSEYKRPDEPDVLPPPSAIVLAPATFNTINKWAAGISDTLALGLLNEAIGKRLPVVVVPFFNTVLAAHPLLDQSVERLRGWGVKVLYGPEVFELPEPGGGGQRLTQFPWSLALDAVTAMAAAPRAR
jgi:phosphopantothenoylcysteine synthetase/decarboxylase